MKMSSSLIIVVGFLCLATLVISGEGARGPTSDAGLKLIKEFEGFVPRPKPDPIGLPTVGYGHLCKKHGCSEVHYPFPLTEATATALMKEDLKGFESCVDKYIKASIHLTEAQFSALASWAFNVGCGNVKSSSLVKRLNAGQSPCTVIREELPKWNKGGGKVLPGLVRRRAAEVKLACQ